MPRNEGIVMCVRKDGSAQVYIGPGESGIPGAPDVNVCHCATESSNILIEAVNRAGASSGDLVSVYRRASVLIRNAAALIGTPLLGTLFGILFSARLLSGAGHTGMGAIPAALGTAAGLLAGIVMYRRFSGENQCVITHVLKKGVMDPASGGFPGCELPAGEAKKAACDGCALNRA